MSRKQHYHADVQEMYGVQEDSEVRNQLRQELIDLDEMSKCTSLSASCKRYIEQIKKWKVQLKHQPSQLQPLESQAEKLEASIAFQQSKIDKLQLSIDTQLKTRRTHAEILNSAKQRCK